MNRKALSKKFFQVKQKIGESTGNKEKTSIFDEDLDVVDKNLENIRLAITKTSKHLSTMIDSSYSGDNKHLQLNNKVLLGQTMLGYVNNFDQDSLLGSTLAYTGQAMIAMGLEMINYETSIQQNILDYFTQTLDKGFKKVDKQKKKCSAARLDMDSIKSRLMTMKRTASQQAPANFDKINNVEKELEDMSKKFEIQKDLLTIEMLNLISSQKTISEKFLSIISIERDFHSNSLTILTALVDQLKDVIDSTALVPVFGLDLEEYKNIYKEDISYVLRDCFNSIRAYGGFETEGIFRIASGATKILKLKNIFNCGFGNTETFSNDVHSFACVVKQYLRELPNPILTYELISVWKEIGLMDEEKRADAIRNTLDKLPIQNRYNLKYMFSFFSNLANYAYITKMTHNNLAIVIGPNILWDMDDSMAIKTNQLISLVAETMIKDYNKVFGIDPQYTWIDDVESKIPPINRTTSVGANLIKNNLKKNPIDISDSMAGQLNNICDINNSSFEFVPVIKNKPASISSNNEILTSSHSVKNSIDLNNDKGIISTLKNTSTDSKSIFDSCPDIVIKGDEKTQNIKKPPAPRRPPPVFHKFEKNQE